ncbi:MAG: hypothetical protein LQ338_003171 [Usnochroma carphineum]|nr:MAG: hypothetical protein LQ338_003171 [Usnochroma carphineum]
MSLSYLREHEAENNIRALDQKVSLLLTKSKEQAGKNEHFEKKIRALEKRNDDLETRLKASEHNALARHLNALIPPSSHQPLHPLNSIHTNQPLKNFPKHEHDIRTMSHSEVATLLKELDADVTTKVSVAERKTRLKELIGVGEKAGVVESGAVKEGVKEVDGVVDGLQQGEKEKKKPVKLPGLATGPPPGKVLPIAPKD